MRKRLFKSSGVVCCLIHLCLFGHFQASGQEAGEITFMFYNVENLFDIKDDPFTADEEFTPEGDKRWTRDRYYGKIDRIGRVITAVGGWSMPAIVGLCEIENASVLYDLAGHRLLKKYDYHVIHKESPDQRGIDVALMYRPDVFSPIASSWVRIDFEMDSSMRTRDILYSKGSVFGKDTLHVLINHWPSRWGGVQASQPKRIEVARHLKTLTDSLLLADPAVNIIIAGDFNDTPADSSISVILGAVPPEEDNASALINLSVNFSGTLKYRSDWEVYDQIIVSASALELEHSGLVIRDADVFSEGFLLDDDEKYLGRKPFRTYSGPQYLGGFSDHLPVFLRFGPVRP